MVQPIQQAVANGGSVLLPIPKGATLIHCPRPGCHAALIATGGEMIHHDDGSHTYRPVSELPVELPASSLPRVTGL